MMQHSSEDLLHCCSLKVHVIKCIRDMIVLIIRIILLNEKTIRHIEKAKIYTMLVAAHLKSAGLTVI